jgi:hypothetical protein
MHSRRVAGDQRTATRFDPSASVGLSCMNGRYVRVYLNAEASGTFVGTTGS